jgi:hypothetical protein
MFRCSPNPLFTLVRGSWGELAFVKCYSLNSMCSSSVELREQVILRLVAAYQGRSFATPKP